MDFSEKENGTIFYVSSENDYIEVSFWEECNVAFGENTRISFIDGDVGKVLKDCRQAFENCFFANFPKKLTLHGSCDAMFSNAKVHEDRKIDVSRWNTSEVTSWTGIFYGIERSRIEGLEKLCVPDCITIDEMFHKSDLS
jgi:hypothetical protein